MFYEKIVPSHDKTFSGGKNTTLLKLISILKKMNESNEKSE